MSISVFKSQRLNWDSARRIHSQFGNLGQLSNFGPLVTKLESDLARLLRVEVGQVVSFNSGTQAITSAYKGIPATKLSVVIPDFSFLATLRAVQGIVSGDLSAGESATQDWSLSSEVKDADVLIPVVIFGSSPVHLLKKFSGRTMIVDAAASMGSLPDLSKLESNQAVCFSLHATKILGAGEGGFAVFGNPEWADRARAWSNFGRSASNGFSSGGSNGKMSEVQAAFVLAQLEEFPEQLESWKTSQQMAREATERLGFEYHPQAFEHPNPYWVVKFRYSDDRKKAERLLTEADIEFRHWWPTSLAKLNGQDEFPNAKHLRETTLGLPMYLGIREKEISLIEGALKPVSYRD